MAQPVPEVQAYQNQKKKSQEAKAKIQHAQVVVPESQVQAPIPTAPHSNQHLFIDKHNPSLRRTPMLMRQCPSCGQESRTRIRTAPAWQTYLAAGGLCLAFWPVSFAPLVVDNCKKTEHFCVICSAKVGTVEPFQDCCVTTRS